MTRFTATRLSPLGKRVSSGASDRAWRRSAFKSRVLPSNAKMPVQAPVDALPSVLEALWTGETRVISQAREIDIVGHRIVHGGIAHRDSEVLTPAVRDAISKQVEFAPAHNRFELEAIATVDRIIGPAVRQVAVFDTGFHATLPPSAYVYPGPYSWLQEGVRRFGFHGISHQYASRRAAQLLGQDRAFVAIDYVPPWQRCFAGRNP